MSQLTPLINELIDEVEARMQVQFAGNPTTLVASLEQQIQIRENLTRPTLALLLGSLFGLERKILIDLTASIEMLHHAKLVHDNLANKSLRQIPHATFITSATVLAGDLAFAAAAQLATAPQSTAVMRIFSETLQLMVSGEITHMFQNGSSFEREAYNRRTQAKTASLFELACQSTAILADMGDKIVNTTRRFGHVIGMAYQIVQDIHDFQAKLEAPKRSTGNNLHSGVATLPTIYYFEAHPHDPDIKSIINHNGNGHITIERITKAIWQSGAIEQSLDEAKAYIQCGIEMLKNLPNKPERNELELLVTQIIPSNIKINHKEQGL
jgi:geranylgeranyl pyrophosphate synthase